MTVDDHRAQTALPSSIIALAVGERVTSGPRYVHVRDVHRPLPRSRRPVPEDRGLRRQKM